MISPLMIDEAAERINPHILKTPLIKSRWLSQFCEGEVYLKLESEQYTGSFKARGALNKLMWLQEQNIKKMPVTASTGNHGLGFARALDLLDMRGKIYLPKNAVSSKIEAIRSYGADIEFFDGTPYATEMHARREAEHNGWIYVSPYNDAQVIAGQGTIGAEITDQIEAVDTLLATVGGGGLITGTATYLKNANSNTKIAGCQPENSPEMAVSVQAGAYREVKTKPTLSDGSAGGFERDAITFEICKKLVNQFMLVSEQEIARAIRLMLKHHHKLIEGAAGVAVASLLQNAKQFENKTTVVIICGANIALQKLREII